MADQKKPSTTKATKRTDAPRGPVPSSLKALARLLAQSAARTAFETHHHKKDEEDHEPKK